MARKNPFANLMDERPEESRPVLDYTIKGASKSIISSIDEIAARADKLLEGQTIIEVEPDEIDGSFVRDRMATDAAEDAELLEAIRAHGQESPVLLRPHPRDAGRYMVVFGHRRVRIARELGRKVRAVVRAMDDRAHVVAQGQENSARANLSFIEKALFAGELARLNYDADNQTVLAALSIDRATLSKMLSVCAIPRAVLDAIGPAKGIGRDRWYELKLLLERPAHLQQALAAVGHVDFHAIPSSDDRFNRLVAVVKAGARTGRKPRGETRRNWSSADRRVAVDIRSDGKQFTLALKARDAVAFGEFVSGRLAELYDAYRRDGETAGNQGD